MSRNQNTLSLVADSRMQGKVTEAERDNSVEAGVAMRTSTTDITTASFAAAPEQSSDDDTASQAGRKGKRKGKKHQSGQQRVKRNKKPKDMPRRPLSAYNAFFREERNRLLNLRRERGQSVANSAETFSSLGKAIAKRWKELTAKEKKKYEELAEEDLQRYRREMDEYQTNLAKRCKAEQKRFDEENGLVGKDGLDQTIQGQQGTLKVGTSTVKDAPGTIQRAYQEDNMDIKPAAQEESERQLVASILLQQQQHLSKSAQPIATMALTIDNAASAHAQITSSQQHSNSPFHTNSGLTATKPPAIESLSVPPADDAMASSVTLRQLMQTGTSSTASHATAVPSPALPGILSPINRLVQQPHNTDNMLLQFLQRQQNESRSTETQQQQEIIQLLLASQEQERQQQQQQQLLLQQQLQRNLSAQTEPGSVSQLELQAILQQRRQQSDINRLLATVQPSSTGLLANHDGLLQRNNPQQMDSDILLQLFLQQQHRPAQVPNPTPTEQELIASLLLQQNKSGDQHHQGLR